MYSNLQPSSCKQKSPPKNERGSQQSHPEPTASMYLSHIHASTPTKMKIVHRPQNLSCLQASWLYAHLCSRKCFWEYQQLHHRSCQLNMLYGSHLHSKVSPHEVLPIQSEGLTRTAVTSEGNVSITPRPTRVLPPWHPDPCDLPARLEKFSYIIFVASPWNTFNLRARAGGGAGGSATYILPR